MAAAPSTMEPSAVGAGRRRPARWARCSELAGGMIAECAAVFCCCPLAVLDLTVLVLVRLPAGICRRAVRCRRRLQKPATAKGRRSKAGDDFPPPPAKGDAAAAPPAESSATAGELDREMWAQFRSAGFGRSPSQRE